MIILVPFFGDRARFRPLLDQWIEAYKSSGCSVPWYALSEAHAEYGLPSAAVSLAPFADLIRPGQPFDVKGALICGALLQLPEPLLVLDADAFLAKDPRSLLEHDLRVLGMCVDGGALMFGRDSHLETIPRIRKMCAGVMLFGGPDRALLVREYRSAYHWLLGHHRLPWSPPLSHLLEQHAWSVVFARCRGRVLPATMNWAPHFLGESSDAIVNHHYGHAKWGV